MGAGYMGTLYTAFAISVHLKLFFNKKVCLKMDTEVITLGNRAWWETSC